MILKTRGGNHELRIASLDSFAAMQAQAGGGRVSSGVLVDQRSLFGLAAADACIRLASSAVAKRSLRVWRGEGVETVPVKTTWQARFFGGTNANARESWFLVLEQTEASLTARNNAFWLKIVDRSTGQVSEVVVISPDDVQARWNRDKAAAEYKIRVVPGTAQFTDWLDASEILHFRVGYPAPGSIVAPTPVELHRELIGTAIAKNRYESTVYSEGLLESVAVTFPEKMTPEQAQKFRDKLKDEHGGVMNAGRVRVFGGGATVQTIGLNLADAEFVASKAISAREMAQILGMPASLVDANDKDTRPLTPEHEEDRFNRYWLEPRLARIQETIRSDPSFFGSGARDRPGFGDLVVRADVATEARAVVSLVQAGVYLPDDGRARLGLPPLPNGAGQIPQIVPVGGMANPDQIQPTDPEAPV